MINFCYNWLLVEEKVNRHLYTDYAGSHGGFKCPLGDSVSYHVSIRHVTVVKKIHQYYTSFKEYEKYLHQPRLPVPLSAVDFASASRNLEDIHGLMGGCFWRSN